MMIRKAKPEDAIDVAPLIIQAMGELANKFSNTKDHVVTLALFEHFFGQPNNQYSYAHTLVYEENGVVLGSLNAYDGAKLEELRRNFLKFLAEHHNLKNLNLEAETQKGEFYFDTLSVNKEAQGKGIGKQLITAGIEWAKELGHHKVGLLVEFDNLKAFSLYKKMGFEVANEMQFMGGQYLHVVLNINN